jgi:tRNA(adenine34) deaminase
MSRTALETCSSPVPTRTWRKEPNDQHPCAPTPLGRAREKIAGDLNDHTSANHTTRRSATGRCGYGGDERPACSGHRHDRDTENHSGTTGSDVCGSIGLPDLFGCSPQAEQIACRLLAVAPSVEDQRTHERFMRLAIELSNGNPSFPFGAVIVDYTTGEVLGQGANRSFENPMFHGEVVAINDCVARNGDASWDRATLYSTGEPCAMCCGALAWAGIRRVVWASSVAAIRASGIPQIDISAVEVAARAYEFYKPELFLGGVLADEMDKRFAARVR